MTNQLVKKLYIICFSVLLTDCPSSAFDNENENVARNKGAVGGTLLGASLGILLGDPTLALQGAAVAVSLVVLVEQWKIQSPHVRINVIKY